MAIAKQGSFRTSMNGFHRGDVMAFIEELSIEHEKEQKILRRQLQKLKEELKQAKENRGPVVEAPAVDTNLELETYRRAEAVERKAKEQADALVAKVQAVIAQTQGMWETSQEDVAKGISEFSHSLAQLEQQFSSVHEMLQVQEKALKEAL